MKHKVQRSTLISMHGRMRFPLSGQVPTRGVKANTCFLRDTWRKPTASFWSAASQDCVTHSEESAVHRLLHTWQLQLTRVFLWIDRRETAWTISLVHGFDIVRIQINLTTAGTFHSHPFCELFLIPGQNILCVLCASSLFGKLHTCPPAPLTIAVWGPDAHRLV